MLDFCVVFFCRNFVGSPTREPCLFLTRDFSLDRSKISKAILLYAKRALGCITEKETYTLTRDFFVRQVKGLEDYIIICREGFGLYNGKRSETYILTRDFFVRRFKDSAADMNIGKEALGCITEKDPSKIRQKKSKRQRTDTILRSNLYLLRFTLKRLMRPS